MPGDACREEESHPPEHQQWHLFFRRGGQSKVITHLFFNLRHSPGWGAGSQGMCTISGKVEDLRDLVCPVQKPPRGAGKRAWPCFPGEHRDLPLFCRPGWWREAAQNWLGSAGIYPWIEEDLVAMSHCLEKRKVGYRLDFTPASRIWTAQALGGPPSHPWPSLATSRTCLRCAFKSCPLFSMLFSSFPSPS